MVDDVGVAIIKASNRHLLFGDTSGKVSFLTQNKYSSLRANITLAVEFANAKSLQSTESNLSSGYI